jgi:quinol monooxygenase YgiN
MVKHIIIWRLLPQAHGNSAAVNAQHIKEKLEALAGKIPGLLKIEVGIDFSRKEDSGDLVLYSEFADRAALEAYKVHPDHQAVFPFIAQARASRVVADYELP